MSTFDTTFSNHVGPAVEWSIDDILAAQGAFMAQCDAANRRILRGMSEAIEQVGPCPKCGRKITYRSENGDAITLCENAYRQLIAQCDRSIKRGAHCGILFGLRL